MASARQKADTLGNINLIIFFVGVAGFDWRRLLPMLIETASLSGAILLIIGTATGMAWGLTQSGFSRALAAAMTGLPGGDRTIRPALRGRLLCGLRDWAG